MEVNADPTREQLQQYLHGIRLDDPASYHGQLCPVLENEAVFSVNLYQASFGEKIEGAFQELITGPHAVRKTLKRYILQKGRLVSFPVADGKRHSCICIS